MTRKKLGKQVRKSTSVKLEPDVLIAIKDIYGTFSNFVEIKVNRDRKIKKKLKTIRSI